MKTMFLALALSCVAMPCLCQTANPASGTRSLPAGTALRGLPSKAGGTDIYTFVTLPGDSHIVTMRSAGAQPVEMLLLDPGGNIVGQASGTREVQLGTIASWGDTYSVAVIRSNPAMSYTIQRSTVPGTLEQFVLAHMVGYKRNSDVRSSRCWIEPNKSLHTDFGDGTWYDRTIEGSRVRYQYSPSMQHGASFFADMQLRDDMISIVAHEPDGDYESKLSLLPERLRYSSDYTFIGYLC